MDDNEAPVNDRDRQLVGRLAAFASAPLDADLAERCASRLRQGTRSHGRALRSMLLVAAVVTALLVTSVGLAAADTLPDSVQDVAHRALDRVGVHVPPGHNRYNDPAACPGGPYDNHGAYVRTHKDDPNAGKSPCGKPVKATKRADGSGTESESGHGKAGTGEKHTGPPPWAHGQSHAGKGDEKTDDKTTGQKNATSDDEEDDAPTGVAPAPSTTSPSHPSSTTMPPTTTTTTTVPEPAETTETSSPQ
jgi:hypothetical protein